MITYNLSIHLPWAQLAAEQQRRLCSTAVVHRRLQAVAGSHTAVERIQAVAAHRKTCRTEALAGSLA